MSQLIEIKKRFPKLSSKARITSPPTTHYNCIAYAAGDHHRWWWPDTLSMAYWPKGCLRLPVLPAFQMAFETLGYTICANSDLESGVEKIAVYHINSLPTHAAKQLTNGMWSSKLGEWFDIAHGHDCLTGTATPDAYGSIAFFMSRKPRNYNQAQ